VATAAGAELFDIEVVCTDQREHQRRVEGRMGDIAGLAPPTWQSVSVHEYEAWEEQPLTLDTALMTADQAVTRVLAHIA